MPGWVEIQDWTYVLCFPALSLLPYLAWRGRTTAIGRANLLFVWSAAAATGGLALASWADTDRQTAAPFIGTAFVLLATLLLRLATLASVQGRRLTLREEAFVWIPPLVVLGISTPAGAAGWASLCFGVAAIRWSQVQLRSWTGFKIARGGASFASLAPGLVALGWAIEPSASMVGILLPLAATALCTALFYALPRMGLSSTDQVHSSTIIEAMSDGVFVVDLHGRIVDCNQAASTILKLDEGGGSLRHLHEALAHHPDLVELLDGAIDGRTVYTPDCEAGEQQNTYDLQLSALCDSTGSIQSRVVVLRDISDRIEVEKESQRQARYVRLVHEVSAAVHEAPTIDEGLQAAIDLIASTMDYPIGQFLETRDVGDLTKLKPSGVFYVDRFLDDAAQIEEALRSVATIDLDQVSEGRRPYEDGPPNEAPDRAWWSEFGYHSSLTFPILVGPNLYGVYEFFSAEPVEVDGQTTELLEHVGELIGRAIERKLAEERIRVLAYRDELTGLPNRQRFHQLLAGAVAHANRTQRRMALLFLDLDGFKKVNDTLGHEVGDHLLAEVAGRFAGVVRSSDHLGRNAESGSESAISRLGGDEFTVVLTEISQPADAAIVAERILATLERPLDLAGQEVFVGTSIGIAIYPDDGEKADRLLRNADAAMYFAKGRGRNGYQFYSEELNRDQECRLEIESRLRGAVERNEFKLHYQPLLSSDTGEIVAAEALLRWENKDLGFVSPDDFIPVAEDSGMIVEIGAWVFRTACQQVRRWHDAGHAEIRIGVNVSGHQIREAGMVGMVGDVLEQSGVAPERVELEITESTIMQDDALTVQTLGELRRMGVGLALDDFGTGYSSLSYLRRFTIDRVKIDRSFVNELPNNADDAALTSAIIAMAHGLRLKVVAEGVETAAQALFLEARGCDELQGYLFGRPCPPEEFEDLLRAKPRPPRELAKDDS